MAMHDWARFAIVLYGVALLFREPGIGAPFLLMFALTEFVVLDR